MHIDILIINIFIAHNNLDVFKEIYEEKYSEMSVELYSHTSMVMYNEKV